MYRSIAASAFLIGSFASVVARAQTRVLLRADDPRRIESVQLAKVVADDATVWLRVQLSGPTHLAVVTAEASVDDGASVDAWLRALDAGTRVRVVAPPGASLNCAGPADAAPSSSELLPIDSGLPEAKPIVPLSSLTADSELELERLLAAAQLPLDPANSAAFSSHVAAPYRVELYSSELTGVTLTLRLHSAGPAGELPTVYAVERTLLPFSFIALASSGIVPADEEPADPSEFAVMYRAATHSTDYLSARAEWVSEHPSHWLAESEAMDSLFAWTIAPDGVRLPAVVAGYLHDVPSGEACLNRASAAASRGSAQALDYDCAGADDLSKTVSELGFQTVRLNRLFGSMADGGAIFRNRALPVQPPRVVASDLDAQGCTQNEAIPPLIFPPSTSSGQGSPRSGIEPTSPLAPDEQSATPVYTSDGSCNVVLGGNDSCSGDARSNDAASDSCSGDSSASEAQSSDSCSGNSDSSGDASDSCSGNSDSSGDASDSCSGSSDSGTDSGGCGKSEYDGDTCSGDSAKGSESRATQSSSALSGAQPRRNKRRRPLRLSLLAVLSAALGLPLRRARGSR